MAQSPELAGGEGFTFEGDVAAFYLAALLAEAHAPGIDDRKVVCVSLQQRDFGEPLDDVIVDFEDAEKRSARLSLQVKRSLTISDAKSNSDFYDIIRDSWATLTKHNFRVKSDRFGAAVNTVASFKARTLRTLCDWARGSLTVDHFNARFATGGSAGKDMKIVKNDVAALLAVAKGASCTSDEVHMFLAHFVLIEFDFLREGATDLPNAINRIRDCLVFDDAAKAPLVWSRVVQLARASAGKSGQFDRAQLVRSISPVARLRGAASYCGDFSKLTAIASSCVHLIPDDIGGTKVDRTSLLDKMDAKLTTARVVQVRGLPGSGKSVVVKRAVERAIERGPVVFLKAEQLEGTSWTSYATSQGLSGAPLEQLLVEVGAAGTAILFIDAIDRIEKLHQPVILDVIRTIVQSRLLDNWRVVVSLRDTGIEVLRNWLGNDLDMLKVETLDVGQLGDEESETLANAKPHLRPLLFGSSQVRDIVRRPFFAKVLNQSYAADPGTPIFAPQSEVDLVENWWRRGGYNETGQSAIKRQRALIDLARVRARELSQPISIGKLSSDVCIDDLKSDGIIQDAREGISVRFAHDVFFEWAFFYALADQEADWIAEVKAAGEPPAVARVVELVSQWEYTRGTNWPTYLAQTEGTELRSQWLRAWLIAPFGAAGFDADDKQFARAVFADDFRLFKKTLVWFQAEKTSPNPNILAGAFPREQRDRFAVLLGWPSDFDAWRRLINFILRYSSDIPPRLYPHVIAIFEVWQNALADLSNPTSRAILQQCAAWLSDIDAITTANGPEATSTYLAKVPDLGAFRKSTGRLILRASRVEPIFASDYLQRVTKFKRFDDETFFDIIAFCPVLAQWLPKLVVELSLAFLCEELPNDQAAREKQEFSDEAEWRKAVLAKPEAERTRLEQMATSGGFHLRSIGDFSYHDWERLSIHDDHRSFWPPSPLREPFYSIFQSSPNEGLRLFRELCNHSMTAWRQLHRHSRERRGTPIPLELTFPWGKQKFWGTDREYLWFRSTWAPNAVGCGFMALEKWCFAELGRGRRVDELIQQVVHGNECIAILGVATMLALHTETVSEVTMSLVSSQRLLSADHARMVQDFSSSMSQIEFRLPKDKPHIEAIQAANARPVRKSQLSWMMPRFLFATGPISNLAREAIRNFQNDLPYQYEEDRNDPNVRRQLTAEALEYAEFGDPKNYQAYRTSGNSNQVVVVHVNPFAAKPENVTKAEEASIYLRDINLWTWASKSLDEKILNGTQTVEGAIVLAKESDASDLFDCATDKNEEDQRGIRRGAVAATAAVVLNFRERCTHAQVAWAREVLGRAIRLPDKPNSMWFPSSEIPWHQAIYVARGLEADLREGTAAPHATTNLLELIAHPLEMVSLAALKAAWKLWATDPKLSWTALNLALVLCHVPSRPRDQARQYGEAFHSPTEAQAAVGAAIDLYENGSGWASLALPPPAWVKVETANGQRGRRDNDDYDANDDADRGDVWGEPGVFWRSELAAKILNCIPFDEIVSSSARNAFLNLLAGVLEWTNQKNAPTWIKAGRRDRPETKILEWTYALGSTLGRVAGLLPLSDFQSRFLEPILGLEGDNCWALLSPFASGYVCAYIFDASVVPAEAVTTLDLCLGRLLQDSTFERNAYRSGEFSGFGRHELVRTLMFVEVERADLAARFVNGDWSEIDLILPLINRFVCAGGWATLVMDYFLTLCERAKAYYPVDAFADQVLAIVKDGPEKLTGWHGTSIPARIAELVQHFAHREAPLGRALAQKCLRILDMLVDMGDRRSAALQLSEAFREIRLDR